MPQPDGYPVATICGSMRFFQRMMFAAEELTRLGYLVFMPFVRHEHGNAPLYEIATPVSKAALDEMHFEKIRRSQLVVVVTDIERYVGSSTKLEIAHAETLGIPVSFCKTHYDHRGINVLSWESDER